MPLNARRAVRRMRGGAQAQLIEADDGNHYVVKFLQNPQHRRILVNELISSVFLEYLHLSQPFTTVVNVAGDFLRDNPDVFIQLGSRAVPVEPGRHFASRFPGDPAKTAVYDVMPDALLPKVRNLPDFRGMVVFDKWMGNADSRQAIFFRARVRELSAVGSGQQAMGFVAQMIDHGYVFNGPHWEFPDSPLQGFYTRPQVYLEVRSLDDFQPWLDRVLNFPEDVMDEALSRIPSEWLDNDDAAHIDKLFHRLLARRPRVPHLIGDSRGNRVNPFPNWQ